MYVYDEPVENSERVRSILNIYDEETYDMMKEQVVCQRQ